MIATRETQFVIASQAIGAIVFSVGCAVLIGWQLDIVLLKSVMPQFVTMKANTAVCFVLSGAILVIAGTSREKILPRSVRLSMRTLTAFLLAIAVATLFQFLFGLDLGIDQFLYPEVQTALTPYPGRMSPASALNFILVGAAFWFLSATTPHRHHPWQWLAVVVFLIGYIGIIGYVYDEQALYHTVMYSSVAVHTAALLVLLAVGLLLVRPASGFMRFIVDSTASGVLLRRLLPIAILLPPLIDWLQVHSVAAGGYRIVFSAMLNVAFLVLFVAWTSSSVRQADGARRAAENSVRMSEERLRIALHAAAGGAWDWDLTTGIAWWSPEMYALWDVSPGTVMTLDNSVALIAAEDRAAVNTTVESSIATRLPYHCEYRLQKATAGGERWIASRGRVVLDAAGIPTRLIGISLDITAQKRAERDLLQAYAALERSNAELKRFAHVASHDLQTPMRSVASFAELIRLHYQDRLDARGRGWLVHIEQSVHQLQTLVRDLLHYAGLDARIKPFVRVDMQNVAERAIALLDSAIRDTEAQVTYADLPTIVGDETLLLTLLQNLIANALRYRSKDAPRIHISAQRIDNAWRFAVRDNGIGIAPQHHDRIFETFQRLHRWSEIPGTGIGLSICRRVVDIHGGKLWVESELDRGSTFFFTVPDAPAK